MVGLQRRRWCVLPGTMDKRLRVRPSSRRRSTLRARPHFPMCAGYANDPFVNGALSAFWAAAARRCWCQELVAAL